MEVDKAFNKIYAGKKVLVTGHTGFKGSWMVLWLEQMGAKVYGISLAPQSDPNHFELLNFQGESYMQDITNKDALERIIKDIDPDIIFHLAAQALVRLSYQETEATFLTNIMGTVNVLEAARKLANLKAIVVVSSDKCYENKEWVWGYRENEPMGGKDPYSASKGCTELITASYRHSFFNPEDYGKKHNILLASARAGNVIGGGDWAADRLVPDMVKAAEKKDPLYIRFPGATRPWQHVLEPLSGYLCVGWKLLEGKKEFAEAWNFGPENENNLTVKQLVDKAQRHWSNIEYDIDKGIHPHEANFLMLDSSKARKLLNWMPVWRIDDTISNTIIWYKEYYQNKNIISREQLKKYVSEAGKNNIGWASA